MLSCFNISGVWAGPPGFTSLTLVQSGCKLSGWFASSDRSSYVYGVSGTLRGYSGSLSEDRAEVTIARIDPNNCRTSMYATLNVIPNNVVPNTILDIDVTRTDGYCGLPQTHTERRTYSRKSPDSVPACGASGELSVHAWTDGQGNDALRRIEPKGRVPFAPGRNSPRAGVLAEGS